MRAPTKRKLTAIMALDIVDYSRLMGVDEVGTLNAMKALRSELIAPKVAQYGGRSIKLMGDGELIEFSSVVEATRAAVEIQTAMSDRNKDEPEDRKMLMRIGLHIGDVIIEGDDIYGDGVNIAARLEGLAPPGGICVSRDVHNQITDKLKIDFVELGPVQVKNIARPVEPLTVVLNDKASALRTDIDTSRASRSQTSLLPQRASFKRHRALYGLALAAIVGIGIFSLVDLQIDAPDEGPTVISVDVSGQPTSLAETFNDELRIILGRYDTVELGSEENSDYRIAAKLRENAGDVRLSYELVNSSTKTAEFTDSFDGDLADLQDFAARIAANVASPGGGVITVQLYEQALRISGDSLSRKQCIALTQIIPDVDLAGIKKVKTCLEGLLKEVPDDQVLLAMMAVHYAKQYWFGTAIDGEAGLDITLRKPWAENSLEYARAASRQAFQENSTVLFGLAHAYYANCDLEGLRLTLERALEINAEDPNLLAPLGNWLWYTGDHELGLKTLTRALEIQPVRYDNWWLWAYGKDHWYRGEYQEALADFRRAYSQDNWLSDLQLAYTLPGLNRTGEAKAAVERLLAVIPSFTRETAATYYRAWCFDDTYISKMDHMLALAGLPANAETAVPESSQ